MTIQIRTAVSSAFFCFLSTGSEETSNGMISLWQNLWFPGLGRTVRSWWISPRPMILPWYNVGPLVLGWFLSPINYSYNISTINHSYIYPCLFSCLWHRERLRNDYGKARRTTIASESKPLETYANMEIPTAMTLNSYKWAYTILYWCTALVIPSGNLYT